MENAHCSCKGGSGDHCNHLFALLFQLNDCSCSRVNTVPSCSSCTSRRQEWHIPRAASICPMPVVATHYARAATDRGSRKRKPVRAKFYDSRSHSAHEKFPTDFVMKEVANLQSKTKPPPFSYLLADLEPSVLVNTVFRNVMAGSVLSYQLQAIGRPQTKLFMERDIPDITFQIPIAEKFEFPELPVVGVNGAVFDATSVSKDFSSFFLENISDTPEDAVALEKGTVLRWESNEWLSERSRRIIASNFGKVLFRVKFLESQC